MMISWVDCNGVRLIKACTDKCTLPAPATAVGRYAEHPDETINGVAPVEIIMNPVKRNAADEASADRHRRRAVVSTQVFPANTSSYRMKWTA